MEENIIKQKLTLNPMRVELFAGVDVVTVEQLRSVETDTEHRGTDIVVVFTDWTTQEGYLF